MEAPPRRRFPATCKLRSPLRLRRNRSSILRYDSRRDDLRSPWVPLTFKPRRPHDGPPPPLGPHGGLRRLRHHSPLQIIKKIKLENNHSQNRCYVPGNHFRHVLHTKRPNLGGEILRRRSLLHDVRFGVVMVLHLRATGVRRRLHRFQKTGDRKSGENE